MTPTTIEADFMFVSTDGGIYGSRQSGFGAPGPENSSSPLSAIRR
jgi:hypothetical protein